MESSLQIQDLADSISWSFEQTVLEAVDDGDIAALALLDLSATYDTVDHSILCKRLWLTFGLDGQYLEWLRSYLHGRS